MKHVFVISERNQTVTNKDYRHMDHCVEYIRQVRLFDLWKTISALLVLPELTLDLQAILCNGDTTLEPLEAGSTRHAIESDTWGSKHLCRDWSVLKEVVWKHTTIGWDKHGFVFDKMHV